ncbi:hypothetical protein [Pseudomonas sp. TH06]|nr:hypothetical protein [Pseudomonas sp. TH06]
MMLWIVQFAGVLQAVVQIETGVMPARLRQGADSPMIFPVRPLA